MGFADTSATIGENHVDVCRLHFKVLTGYVFRVQAFEHVFDTIHRSVTNGGAFVNNE